jgi:alpha-D-xyloside xylohydrolase
MLLEFPEDRTTHSLDVQYMFGPSLLVAPAFKNNEEEVEWYLLKGRWTSFWPAADVIDGTVLVKRKVPYDEIPAFVKPGSLLCLWKR